MAETPNTTNVYGYLPSPKTANIVGSKTPSIYGIKFPIRKSSRDQHGKTVDNKIFSKVTGVELTKNNIIQFLNTEKGERVMRPHFGVDLNKYIFEPMDEILFNIMAQDIYFQVKGYFPWIEIKSFSVKINKKFSDVQGITANLSIKDPVWGINTFDTKISRR